MVTARKKRVVGKKEMAEKKDSWSKRAYLKKDS